MKTVRDYLAPTVALATTGLLLGFALSMHKASDGVAPTAIGLLPMSQARAAEATKDAEAPKATLSVLVKADANAITLLQAGQTAPVTAAVNAQTTITGICKDCMLPMTFKAPAATKLCWVCPCDVSAAACIAHKPLKPGTWNQLVDAMPAGTGLEVLFNEDGKPESGVKSLVINQKRVLVAVDGPGKLDAAGLLAVLKPLGVTAAEFAADNKQIALRVAAIWTASNATKLEQLLAANGIKVVPPAAA